MLAKCSLFGLGILRVDVGVLVESAVLAGDAQRLGGRATACTLVALLKLLLASQALGHHRTSDVRGVVH